MPALTLSWVFPLKPPGVPAVQQPREDGLAAALTEILLHTDYAYEDGPVLSPGTSTPELLRRNSPGGQANDVSHSSILW